MPKLTLTFDPVIQNQKGSSSHQPQLICEVWKWLGKYCSCYRVHKVKRDGHTYARTHPHTHAPTHSLTHSLTQPPTNGRVTISPPTLLRGDNEEVIHPLLSCYFVILSHLMVVSSMSLSFAGNPNFVNTLPLYTFNIQFMYDNLNFSFFLCHKLHLNCVTFLLPVSILYNSDRKARDKVM